MTIARVDTMSVWSAPDLERGAAPRRREVLRWTAALLLGGPGLTQRAHAAGDAAAFDLVSFADVLAALGGPPVDAPSLQFSVPDAVEDGAFVPIEVSSDLPETRTIYLLSESNPYPLVARLDVPDGTDPFLETRIRVQASGRLYAVVRTPQQLAWTSAYTRITRGGCGD